MQCIRVARVRALEVFASCVRGAAVVLATLLAVCAFQANAQIRYYYDELGRLVEVVAPDGQSGQYTYDAVGNILSINRLGTATVSISEFTPNAGPVGTTVTIYGSGFSSTQANNTVKFNGTPAAVSAATASSLIVTVPAGATSGAISVSNSNGSVTSTATFTVGVAASGPTISSFTPEFGAAGSVVSVTGGNFQLSPESNKATLGGVAAAVLKDATSPTSTLLRLAVPNTSGKISIATPYGKATSTADFYALPSTVNAADVEFKGRLIVEGPAVNVVTTSPGKKAVLLFDGSFGQMLHLVTASGTFASGISVAVYAPDGHQVETLNIGNQGLANFVNRLSGIAMGTYTIILSPQSNDQGNVTLSLIADVAGTLTVDGGMSVNLTAGRSGRYRFTAEAGKGYGLALPGFTMTPANGPMSTTLRKSDGAPLANCDIYTSGSSCTYAPSLFASAGTYSIDFVPNGTSSVTFTASFSKDAEGLLIVDGATTTMTIAREGQNGRYTFSGTAGASVGIVLTGMQALSNNSSFTFVQLYRPSDGAGIGSIDIFAGQAGGVLNVTLPETGVYTLFIDPAGLATGTIDVQVKTHATGELTVDGSTPVNLSAGQTGHYSFTAEAGKGYGLGLPGFTMTPANGPMLAALRKPDGSLLANCDIYSSGDGCSYAPSLFASAGTYSIDFIPSGIAAVTFNAVLSKDAGAVLTIGAPAAPTVIARAGQNARYTFSGTAGQAVSVALTASTQNNYAFMRLYRPSDGASIGVADIFAGQAGATINVTLPETGVYSVLVDPSGLGQGSFDMRVIQN